MYGGNAKTLFVAGPEVDTPTVFSGFDKMRVSQKTRQALGLKNLF